MIDSVILCKSYKTFGIISYAIDKRVTGLFLIQLIKILDGISPNNLILIGGNLDTVEFGKYIVHPIKYWKYKDNLISKVIRFTYLQAMISDRVLKLWNDVDVWFFFIGGESLLMPMLVTKLLRKKSVIILLSHMEVELKFHNLIFSKPMTFLKNINLRLANQIIVYSPNIINDWDLYDYKDKISIAHRHFLDFEKFKPITHINKRDIVIGYVGRVSEEKGPLNFVKSISKISAQKTESKFLIIGSGNQYDEIRSYIYKNKLDNVVKLIGWVPHDKLPDHLNTLKLLVIPSYSEGLPNIMLESMACGAPILATSVGSIPDFIKDGETGFLMENNSPGCIAANVIRALDHQDLEGVVQRSLALVTHEFTYENTVERWYEIMERFVNDDSGSD